MNALEEFIARHGLLEAKVMSFLQDHGCISDNCITASDVAEPDLSKAVVLLKNREIP